MKKDNTVNINVSLVIDKALLNEQIKGLLNCTDINISLQLGIHHLLGSILDEALKET